VGPNKDVSKIKNSDTSRLYNDIFYIFFRLIINDIVQIKETKKRIKDIKTYWNASDLDLVLYEGTKLYGSLGYTN